MRAVWLKSIIVSGVSLIASIQVHAQPLIPHAESIESTVANADLVFTGKLVKFDGGEQADAGKGHDATMAVEGALKQDLLEDGPYRRIGSGG